MDITITESSYDQGRFVVIFRTVVEDDGTIHYIAERAPREILAIRAAEYNLAPDDDFVLELVLLEPFMRAAEGPGDVHPLYSADSVKDAEEIMRERVKLARAEHGAPKILMAAAVRKGVASAGLVSVHGKYHESADPRVAEPIQRLRDVERERLAGTQHVGPTDLVQTLLTSSFNDRR